MISPTQKKAWLALAIVATLTSATIPAAASAAATASDEYVLEIPGFRETSNGLTAGSTSPRDRSGDGIQRGVVGEQDPPATPLATLGDALSTFPSVYATGLLTLAAFAVISVFRRRPPSHATR